MRRFLPLVLLAAFSLAGFGLLHGVGWDSLSQHQHALMDWVSRNPVASAVVFVLAYVVTAALSLPHAALMTALGGLLFGSVVGCTLSIAGATIGASILLLVIRSVFSQTLERNRTLIPPHIQARLVQDGFSYLLALRLLPLIPFWVVNLAAAVARIPLVIFVPATVIGTAPASFIISSIGAGIGSILAAGQTPDLSVLFAPRILLPLIGLSILSLLPAILRRRSGIHA